MFASVFAFSSPARFIFQKHMFSIAQSSAVFPIEIHHHQQQQQRK